MYFQLQIKAITRGVEAKQIIKNKKSFDLNGENENKNLELIDQIKELKNLHDKGIINEDEFKKAKEKLLK